MKKSLLQCIQNLPKEIQNIIFEYNVEHRKHMKEIFNEYFKIIYNNCKICNKSIVYDTFYYVDYFIYKKYNISYHWCSGYCFYSDIDRNLKDNYKKKLQTYFLVDSIQHKDEIIDFE